MNAAPVDETAWNHGVLVHGAVAHFAGGGGGRSGHTIQVFSVKW
mgnify:CR=1 FL=1